MAGINYDYSLMKDIALYALNRARNALDHRDGKSMAHVIPETIRALSANGNITKLELRVDGERVNLKAEWRPGTDQECEQLHAPD